MYELLSDYNSLSRGYENVSYDKYEWTNLTIWIFYGFKITFQMFSGKKSELDI